MFLIISIVILSVILLIVWYVIVTQRRLVHLDELCNNAFHQIAVQLSSRWDAVLALVKMTQQYAQHEHATLTDVIAQRRSTQIVTAEQMSQQEGFLAGVLNRLMVLSENYPALKAQEGYIQTMRDIRQYEENVRMGRMVYNDSATIINRMVRQWPSSIVAGMLHFAQREYLKEDETKKGYPNIDLNINATMEQPSGSSIHQEATVQKPANEDRTHIKGFR